MSMPDKWEYPWFAAWDLAFHCVALAHVDPAFAKYQLVLLCREWSQHPSGALPAYEWSFDDVNPPVQAWAALEVFAVDGGRDDAFLSRVFDKLLVNFTWWVNREDRDGSNLFEGGFLGLDNIGPIDRSHLPAGYTLEQSDGTGWMAFYALSMAAIASILTRRGRPATDLVVKFVEHFALIWRALNEQGLWDEEDGFYYDRLERPDGSTIPIKVRSIVGILPLLAVVVLDEEMIERALAVEKRSAALLEERKRDLERLADAGMIHDEALERELLLSVVRVDRVFRILTGLFDEEAFLSPYGLRALSRFHAGNPFSLDIAGTDASVDYEPAESTTGMFGGNSNWRGPIWMPINYLVVSALERYARYFRDAMTVEYPARSGNHVTIEAAAADLRDRLVSIFLVGPDGRRPCYGGVQRLQQDPNWKDNLLFNEYFHGDNGAGLGASHQTGWTGIVADLIIRGRGRHTPT
jgi:Mannosylglycerate hydrolase MGH1-like glycoside hydrolase domain/Glycosyl hydrolase family 63 C-terminal domain